MVCSYYGGGSESRELGLDIGLVQICCSMTQFFQLSPTSQRSYYLTKQLLPAGNLDSEPVGWDGLNKNGPCLNA